MNTAIIIGITLGIIISAGGCIAWYANGVKKRNKRHKEITDEFRMILTCSLYEHNPRMFVAIREDSFGEVTAILKAHGASYNATSSFATHEMVEQAKKAKDFFEEKKPTPWKNNNPQNDTKKGNTMKIIVTGSPSIGPMNEQYEATRWEVNQDGKLIIFGDNDKVVGTHAPGTWAHVRGYVSIDAPSRQAHRLMEALQKRLSEVEDPAASTPVEFRVAMGSGFVMVDGETFRL